MLMRHCRSVGWDKCSRPLARGVDNGEAVSGGDKEHVEDLHLYLPLNCASDLKLKKKS